MFAQGARLVGGLFLDIVETVVIALSIFLIVYLFVMQPHQVNGSSMYPNFEDGEYLLTDKISYRLGEPQRGDVVVFHAPEASRCPEGTGCDFIKRVIAIPGDTIDIQNNRIFVNGMPVSEPYLSDNIVTQEGAFSNQGSYQLPPGNYYVMGDNRNQSSDSRAWGPVPIQNIVGKVFFRYWPPQKLGTLPNYSYE